MAKWRVTSEGVDYGTVNSPREIGDLLRTFDENELIEDEVEITITVEDD